MEGSQFYMEIPDWSVNYKISSSLHEVSAKLESCNFSDVHKVFPASI